MDGEDLQSKPVKSCSRGLYPHILTIDQKGVIKRVRTNEKHEYQNTPKLFLFGYEDPRFYYDKTGNFGAIGNGHHYFIGKNLDKLEKYFNTHLAGLLLHYVKYRQKHIEPKFYPDVRSLPIDITDESLADYFGFTQKEREAILAHPIVDREYTFQDITCDTLRKTQKNI
jgi:hypothetical protein